MVRNETGPAALKSGTASLRETLVQEHWTAVFRMMYGMTGNAHDSEDLTQEAFLRAFDRLDSFQPGTNARGWLLRIAANACVDQARKKRRVSMGRLEDDMAGREAAPGRTAEISEQAALARIAVEELAPTARMVFHLRVVEDLAFKEIAGMLELSEEAARWHMHQARLKLLKRLSRETK